MKSPIYEALKEISGEYVLSFRFKHEVENRTSHHLIFVTKNLRGYEVMKDIMANESSEYVQGIPSFEYNPSTNRQLSLFSYDLYELEAMVLDTFSGRTMTMKEVYDQHHVGKRYTSKSYKKALASLESKGKIVVDPPVNKRRKVKGEITFGDSVKVIFPVKQ